MSIQKNLDERDFRYLQFVVARAHGATDEEVVKELNDPDIDSPQVLYRRLKSDGHSICPICGATYVEENHCRSLEDEQGKLKPQQSGGEAEELPPAASATGLFRDALFVLETEISLLSHRREFLQDERFIVKHEFSGEAGESYERHYRRDMSETAWREYCQHYGGDPSLDYFDVPIDVTSPGGVSQAPPEPLTRLIAVYVLSGLPVDLLVNALHPDSEAADMEELHKHINGQKREKSKFPGLRSKAEDVAKLVRGRRQLRTGRTTGELTRVQEEAAVYIQLRRREGESDTEILRELREGHGFARPVRFGVAAKKGRAWPDITMADLLWLGKLKLGQEPDST